LIPKLLKQLEIHNLYIIIRLDLSAADRCKATNVSPPLPNVRDLVPRQRRGIHIVVNWFE